MLLCQLQKPFLTVLPATWRVPSGGLLWVRQGLSFIITDNDFNIVTFLFWSWLFLLHLPVGWVVTLFTSSVCHCSVADSLRGSLGRSCKWHQCLICHHPAFFLSGYHLLCLAIHQTCCMDHWMLSNSRHLQLCLLQASASFPLSTHISVWLQLQPPHSVYLLPQAGHFYFINRYSSPQNLHFPLFGKFFCQYFLSWPYSPSAGQQRCSVYFYGIWSIKHFWQFVGLELTSFHLQFVVSSLDYCNAALASLPKSTTAICTKCSSETAWLDNNTSTS